MGEQDDKQHHLESLIKQMREGTNEDILRALGSLRNRRWLMDGSLVGSYLRRVNFQNADLSMANLEVISK